MRKQSAQHWPDFTAIEEKRCGDGAHCGLGRRIGDEVAAQFLCQVPRGRWMQTHDGEHAVKEYTKSTWLSPLLAALDEPERSRFEAVYTEMVDVAYPRRPDGKTLFPFRRMFIIATKA